MRVLVTGAYGLIGAACLARLHNDGHAVAGAGRRLAEARWRFPYARWVEADFARLTRVEACRPKLAGVDAVVNCVGVLQDGAGDDTRRVHVEATSALFDACAQASIRRVIHVSAMGAEASGPTAFARTKAQAEAHLMRCDDLDWVILRPALVLAPAVFGGTAMLRGLAAMPWVTPVMGGDSRIQVLAVEDLAATVAFCVGPAAPARVRWDVAHPQVHTLSGIITAVRGWLGFKPQRIVEVPAAVGRLVAAAADGIARLGWRSPARSTASAQLTAGVVGDPAPWQAATGIVPMSLTEILAARPASVQDRWFARLYLLKPLAIAALALFWIATGLIALGPGRMPALAQLAAVGLQSPGLEVAHVGSSLLDVALGALLLMRRTARVALSGMLALAGLYLIGATILAPQLWADPLGPLLKIVPILIATLLTSAILDER
jgi:uncharacterized protein YbjT (DUF2867 family)